MPLPPSDAPRAIFGELVRNQRTEVALPLAGLDGLNLRAEFRCQPVQRLAAELCAAVIVKIWVRPHKTDDGYADHAIGHTQSVRMVEVLPLNTSRFALGMYLLLVLVGRDNQKIKVRAAEFWDKSPS